MDYVHRRAEASGGVITRPELEAFTFEGERVPLIDTGRGIRNPRQLEATISLLMDPSSAYDDEMARMDSFATRSEPVNGDRVTTASCTRRCS